MKTVNDHAKFIILMGSSGSGKTTVLNESGILRQQKVQYVQSYTTRDLREGEVNGEKYHHISVPEFEDMISDEQFLERAQFSFSYYGTSKKSIQEKLASGVSPIKEMEMGGYLKFKNDVSHIPYVSIFLDVDEQTIKERVGLRGGMPDDQLQERLKSAEFERAHAQNNCHHIIDATQPLDKVVEKFIHTLHQEHLL